LGKQAYLWRNRTHKGAPVIVTAIALEKTTRVACSCHQSIRHCGFDCMRHKSIHAPHSTDSDDEKQEETRMKEGFNRPSPFLPSSSLQQLGPVGSEEKEPSLLIVESSLAEEDGCDHSTLLL
jgi:hypothetical protein